jgi:hypothetical protein
MHILRTAQFKTNQLRKGKKRNRKKAAELLLKAMANNEIEAVICRLLNSGPGKTKGFTNMMVFENLKKAKTRRYS